jgi:hypothetical protein
MTVEGKERPATASGRGVDLREIKDFPGTGVIVRVENKRGI